MRGLPVLLLWFAGLSCAAPVRAAVVSISVADSAGPACELLAVALTQHTQSHSVWDALGGWGPGAAHLTANRADFYLFRPSSGQLRKLLSLDAPARWRQSDRYQMRPRILPDGSLLFSLHGCPPQQENCTEQQYYQLSADGAYQQISAWPAASAQESANLRQCTSLQSYQGGKTLINIGPSGGPWRPVLQLEGSVLRPFAAPVP
ncbi:hypothetical protein EAY64_12030 [Aquitalea palustris]|uniref:Uncharacterized protein n=1 Tax=Aquitalea palustris TaxID=2480983 RepID=A0A454JHC8_9NEIS|nr:hypothetical protein [Aquitalea palustris]RMC96493.1 hypothetical protein EAY64_12030 [Aquitalea palustris]